MRSGRAVRLPSSRILADDPDWSIPDRDGVGALGLNRNKLASDTYFFNRNQIDTKVNFNLSDK